MKSYSIKKGSHYSTKGLFERLGAICCNFKTLSVRFKFHTDCYWAPARNPDDNDLNKLTGIGFGLNLHKNSVRLAWVPDFDIAGTIKIYGYSYDEKKVDPKFTFLYITSVPVEQTYEAKIESKAGKYVITVNKVVVEMDNLHKDPKICFRLFPYFGGNNTAPKDMLIEIEYL
jgi:hypothetical protein